jgi:hypothetical protein
MGGRAGKRAKMLKNHTKMALGAHYESDFDLELVNSSANISLCNFVGSRAINMATQCY